MKFDSATTEHNEYSLFNIEKKLYVLNGTMERVNGVYSQFNGEVQMLISLVRMAMGAVA